jgi:hypothetical protein
MALAVQANLVQLKVTDARRQGISPSEHPIQIPSPGFVPRFRETLLDHHRLRDYPPELLHLRLREFWGRFCLMRWAFHGAGDDPTYDFTKLAPDAELRCEAHLVVKEAEIHAMLWRIRFEQRVRGEPGFTQSPTFGRDERVARDIPLQPFGKAPAEASDDELLAVACEHAGMLAVIRWINHRDRDWNDPQAMNAGDQPF